MPVVVILQVKDARESGAGRKRFVPAAVGALRLNQVLDALLQAVAGGVAAGEQSQDRPRRLRWRARGRDIRVAIVALAAFSPPAVGVLNRPQPFARAQDVSL